MLDHTQKRLSRRETIGALSAVGAGLRPGRLRVSRSNPTRNSTDNVFSDGTTNEMATMTDGPSSGYTATLQIGI